MLDPGSRQWEMEAVGDVIVEGWVVIAIVVESVPPLNLIKRDQSVPSVSERRGLKPSKLRAKK